MTPVPQPTTADHRSALVDAILQLLERELHQHQVTYVWPETGRILFRTADDRTGSVDVLFNFDSHKMPPPQIILRRCPTNQNTNELLALSPIWEIVRSFLATAGIWP